MKYLTAHWGRSQPQLSGASWGGFFESLKHVKISYIIIKFQNRFWGPGTNNFFVIFWLKFLETRFLNFWLNFEWNFGATVKKWSINSLIQKIHPIWKVEVDSTPSVQFISLTKFQKCGSTWLSSVYVLRVFVVMCSKAFWLSKTIILDHSMSLSHHNTTYILIPIVTRLHILTQIF